MPSRPVSVTSAGASAATAPSAVPSAGTPGSALTVADLVGAAVGILGEFGLADLSMRRVAAVLEVRPSALYWHVRDKQTLLGLVADRVLEQVTVPADSGDWIGDLRARAEAVHATLLSVRDSAELVSSTVALGLGGDRLRRILADPLARSGLSESEAAVLADAVLALLLGSSVMAQQRRQAEGLGVDLGSGPVPVADFAAMLTVLLRRG